MNLSEPQSLCGRRGRQLDACVELDAELQQLLWDRTNLVGVVDDDRSSADDTAAVSASSSRIMGTLGKIIVECLGAVVAMLSVTGVIIWARKQRRRNRVTPR